MSSGNSSSLPASMSNIRTNLENGEKIEKFCVGPTRFNPGPILFNTVTTEVKFVEKSNSSTLIRSIEVSSSTK